MFSVCSTAPMHGDREVQLEVALGVPGERRHAIALLDAERSQRAREPVDALGDLRVGDARHRAVGLQRHDLRARVHDAHPAAHVVQRQLEVVLHQSLQHLASSPRAPSRLAGRALRTRS